MAIHEYEVCEGSQHAVLALLASSLDVGPVA